VPGEDRSVAGELARILGAAGITVRTGVTAGAVELGGSAGQLAEPRGGGYAAPYRRKPTGRSPAAGRPPRTRSRTVPADTPHR
jgi:hypothetical protein